MAAQSKTVKVTGKIVPLQNGTRLRVAPSTYTAVVTSYNAGANVEIEEVLEYLENDPAQPATWKGDKWGKVIKVNGVATPQPSWMAIWYHNDDVCSEYYTVVTDQTDPTDPTDPPAPIFPESFVLTDPSGAKAEYEFVRIIEE